MHMKRLIACFLSAILVFARFPANDFAASAPSGVYAAPKEQEKIYQALMASEELHHSLLDYYELSLVRASISPIYDLDEKELLASGELEIYPLTREYGQEYAIKVIDKNDMYAGNLMFFYDGKTAAHFSFPAQPYQDLLKAGGFIGASLSYADQAERIRTLLGAESIIAPENVKVVLIGGIGYAFYIQSEAAPVFVSAGKTSFGTTPGFHTDGACYDVFETDRIILVSREMADREQSLAWQIEELMTREGLEFRGMDDYYARLQSGELDFFKFTLRGGDISVSFETPAVENVGNILDIEAYFEANVPGYSGARTAFPMSWACLWVGIGALMVTLFIVIIGRKKKSIVKDEY